MNVLALFAGICGFERGIRGAIPEARVVQQCEKRRQRLMALGNAIVPQCMTKLLGGAGVGCQRAREL